MLSEHLRQGPSVDACHTWYLLATEPITQALYGIPVRILLGIVADDEGLGINTVALHKIGYTIITHAKRGYTIVAHQWISHHEHLPRIAGVCQTLRITHHGRVEHHLSDHFLIVAEALPSEFCSVLQDECYIFHLFLLVIKKAKRQ